MFRNIIQSERVQKFNIVINRLRYIFDTVCERYDRILKILKKNGITVSKIYHFTSSRRFYISVKRNDKLMQMEEILQVFPIWEVQEIFIDDYVVCITLAYDDIFDTSNRSTYTTDILNSAFNNAIIQNINE